MVCARENAAALSSTAWCCRQSVSLRSRSKAVWSRAGTVIASQPFTIVRVREVPAVGQSQSVTSTVRREFTGFKPPLGGSPLLQQTGPRERIRYPWCTRRGPVPPGVPRPEEPWVPRALTRWCQVPSGTCHARMTRRHLPRRRALSSCCARNSRADSAGTLRPARTTSRCAAERYNPRAALPFREYAPRYVRLRPGTCSADRRWTPGAGSPRFPECP